MRRSRASPSSRWRWPPRGRLLRCRWRAGRRHRATRRPARRSTWPATRRTSPTPTAGRPRPTASCPRSTGWPSAQHIGPVFAADLLAQAARPSRPALTPAMAVPGWNSGNPYRADWAGTRGQMTPVSFTNRYGALVQGDVFAPLPGATDPYTGEPLEGPFPGVVITTGSVQGSERMYWWLAAGPGRARLRRPHLRRAGTGPQRDVPAPRRPSRTCRTARSRPPRPPARSPPARASRPSRRPTSSTARRTRSTSSSPPPTRRTRTRPRAAPTSTTYNPLWESVRPLPRPGHRHARPDAPGWPSSATRSARSRCPTCRRWTSGSRPSSRWTSSPPGRRSAAATSSTRSARWSRWCRRWACSRSTGSPWRRTSPTRGCSTPPASGRPPRRPTRAASWPPATTGGRRPASTRWWSCRGPRPTSSTPTSPTCCPPRATGRRWPASTRRRGWRSTCSTTRRPTRRCSATTLHYLEPDATGTWQPVSLDRAEHLSFYFCSGYDIATASGRAVDDDIAGVGCD